MKFLGFMWNPLSWVMEAAAIMAIALANGGVSGLSFWDFILAMKVCVCRLILRTCSLKICAGESS